MQYARGNDKDPQKVDIQAPKIHLIDTQGMNTTSISL